MSDLLAIEHAIDALDGDAAWAHRVRAARLALADVQSEIAALRAENEAMRKALLDTDHTPRCKFAAWQREGTASEYVCVCGKAALAAKEEA